jgi:pimeloyl-ACP methyl ester carboxylesterase
VPSDATLVLVHGAWHGAWCWDRVRPGLALAGVPAVAIDLPGHGASTEPLGDLASDAHALRQAIDAVGGPVVVVAHSYGGAVTAVAAADHPEVRHLVFLAAFPLDVGESCMNAAADEVAPEDGTSLLGEALQVGDDGTITLDPVRAEAALFNECAPADVAWAVERLGPQSLAELQGVATAAAWRTIPSTYVVCTKDQAVALPVQRALATRCSSIVELDADHSLFASRADDVVRLLVAIAHEVSPDPASTKG